jgi:hypothetical protein
MSAFELKDLEKIPNNFIIDFVGQGLMDWSVIEQCKQFDRAQQEKEKQQAIQQFTKRKKHPPMSPFFQLPPATTMPTHKVVQKISDY